MFYQFAAISHSMTLPRGCRSRGATRSRSAARVPDLLRFDDICPTMNWGTWDAGRGPDGPLGLRPILAVVPDNRDPKLVAGPPRADFWERVRGWQARGWTIALHGYQHLYVTRATRASSA